MKHTNIYLASLAFWALMLIFAAAPSNAFAQSVCGNGVVEAAEQCDNGGQSGGCCTAECRFAPEQSFCTDGNPNTMDSCNPTGVCDSRLSTTTCGACRNENDAQDRSYCDLTTNQCVRQIADCAPFFIDANGDENKCQRNYGRDQATGQCLYRPSQCLVTGCLSRACNPTNGVCELVTTGPRATLCGGSDEGCSIPAGGCPANTCQFQSCLPGSTPNCQLTSSFNCNARNISSCQVGVPPSTQAQITAGSCQINNGCVFTATACAPPENPCEELVRNPNAEGCCTYRPRDCAAEFNNNPNFTYSCDPTATNGVCKATIKPEFCNGADDNGNGQIDENFPNTDGDGQANCVDPDDDNDGVEDAQDAFPLDATESVDTDADGTGNNADLDDDNDNQTDRDEIACGSNPLFAASKSLDTDNDNRPNCVDADDDNDGVIDAADNCSLVANPDQADTDDDGIGDACDTQNVSVCFGRQATVTDNSPGDTDSRVGFIRGGNGADVIIGGNGSEIIDGGNGDDIICGGAGNDQITGGNGDDQINGGSGNDRLDGENGNDRLDGGSGDDQLTGGKGNDQLTGGAGADCFTGDKGSDTATDCAAEQGDRRDNTVETGACAVSTACS